jgi:hypothetical protein
LEVQQIRKNPLPFLAISSKIQSFLFNFHFLSNFLQSLEFGAHKRPRRGGKPEEKEEKAGT